MKFLTILFNVTFSSARIETQIGIFRTESHLEYGYGSGSSNSDFWKDPGRQEPFGAVCINTITNHYKFNNGLELAISDTTLKEMMKNGEADLLLRSTTPVLGRTTFLGNFQRVEGIKSAEKLAEFCMDAHTRVGWQMSDMISHTVDSAANAVAGAEEMKFLTQDARPHDIHMMKCMPHKASTSAMAASGTSDHVENLNPTAGEILKKCHRLSERIHRKRPRRDAVVAVHKARKRTKYPSIQPGVVTRWGSYQKEAGIFNCTRHDLHQSLHDMLDEGGCDNGLMKGEKVVPEVVRAENTVELDEWQFLQQYEGGMDPIYRLIIFMQNKRAMAHEELFQLMSCLERLGTKFFLAWEDVSRNHENENLKDRNMNVCVKEKDFKFIGNSAEVVKYKSMDQDEATEEIMKCRRICFRQMGVRVRILLLILQIIDFWFSPFLMLFLLCCRWKSSSLLILFVAEIPQGAIMY